MWAGDKPGRVGGAGQQGSALTPRLWSCSIWMWQGTICSNRVGCIRQGGGMNWVNLWAAGDGVRHRAGVTDSVGPWGLPRRCAGDGHKPLLSFRPGLSALVSVDILACGWRSQVGQLRAMEDWHWTEVNRSPPSEEGGYCQYIFQCWFFRNRLIAKGAAQHWHAQESLLQLQWSFSAKDSKFCFFFFFHGCNFIWACATSTHLESSRMKYKSNGKTRLFY